MKEVAVVTGAASGIGRGIAKRLAEDYTVILIDLNPKTLPVVEKELIDAGHQAYSVLGDVGQRATHQNARALAESKGNLISWVNCAGWTRGAPMHDFPNDPAVLEDLIGANQIGSFWGCAEAVASFTTRKVPGAIVNISSVHGRRAWPDHAVYEMTKAAVDALTRNVAVAYGPFGIRANAVAPGAILTPALEQSFVDAPDPVARRNSLELLAPLKRIGEPSEIAEVVSFLLSTRASYLSGQSIAVEGAWTVGLGVPEIDSELAKRYGLDSKTGLPKS
jgi:NAD(P)-dependent dehydrogenase (short-subunit alcohol dehydrogenase family)|uniref:SDR family NAD(P)-dependent oxidoreductase n=1 Tax=Candidatus Planktophila sp. TaxID=2175601 RepID=UPI00404B4FF2